MSMETERGDKQWVMRDKHLRGKLEQELKWLERNIGDIRRELERGLVYEDLNIVSKAADVQRITAKLDMMRQTRSMYVGEKE